MPDIAPCEKFPATLRWVTLIYCLPILVFVIFFLPMAVNSIEAIMHGTHKFPVWFPALIGWHPLVSLVIITMVWLRGFRGWLVACWAPVIFASLGGVLSMFFFMLHFNGGVPNTIEGIGGICVSSGMCLFYGLMTFAAHLLLRKPEARSLFADVPM